MLTNSLGFMLWITALLPAGIALQLWAVLFPRRRSTLCLYVGAVLVAIAALHDRDLILFLGQSMALPLLWLLARNRT